MNPIHKKLATTLVSSFRHINTSIMSVEEYLSTLGKELKPFKIGDVQYWLYDAQYCPDIYIWDGSMLMHTVVGLSKYEVLYLLEGHEYVNAEGLYHNELLDKYMLTSELREELEGATEEQKEYLRRRCKRVTLNEDGSVSHS